MIKTMCVEIPIDTEIDTIERINGVMYNVIEACNDLFMAVNKVTLDGEILYGIGSGFNRELVKRTD